MKTFEEGGSPDYSDSPFHEEMITTSYCDDCNTTYEFYSLVQLGGRESEPLLCPDCNKPLGRWIETESLVYKRTTGNTRAH